MQTINYTKWIYKLPILGLLFLMTACEPPATKDLEKAAAPVINLAKAAADPVIKEILDALNALDLKNPEVIRKVHLTLDALNALAQSGVDAQKSLNALTNASLNDFIALKDKKNKEGKDALTALETLHNDFNKKKMDLSVNPTQEEGNEYLSKVQPAVDNGSVKFNLSDKLYTDAKAIWKKVSQFK